MVPSSVQRVMRRLADSDSDLTRLEARLDIALLQLLALLCGSVLLVLSSDIRF